MPKLAGSYEIVVRRIDSMIYDLKTQNWRRSRPAFTLIELLLAISIVGILAGIIAYSMSGQQRKARDLERKNDLNQVKRAMESAKNDCVSGSYYPYSGGGAANPDQAFSNIATYLKSNNLMQETPMDPKNAGENVYRLFATSDVPNICPDQSGNPKQNDGVRNYVLVTQLEIQNDPDAAKSKASCADAIDKVDKGPPGSFDPDTIGYYFTCPD